MYAIAHAHLLMHLYLDLHLHMHLHLQQCTLHTHTPGGALSQRLVVRNQKRQKAICLHD